MKQRISVRALIEVDDTILLLRRANGRNSIIGKYEIPGGKIAYREQPEDALRRYLHEDAGLHIGRASLFDAVTYIDHDDRDIQYAVIVYTVTLASGHHDLRLSQNYDKYIWKSETNTQHHDMTDLTNLILGIVRQEHITDVGNNVVKNIDDKNTSNSVIIYSDGGSRGNPGPSAAGFVIIDKSQEVVSQGGEYLGITTNNQAEYHGLRLGLEKAIELGYRNIDFRLDSMLVVNQMNGIYKIKNRELWPIHERIRGLLLQFDKVTFSHVRREYNQLADGMVNRTLDAHANDQ
ncbi:reverse transcriptase-like protein [bacterium]|nr:MAG: reverse transcriptase-like protein [bacterium]